MDTLVSLMVTLSDFLVTAATLLIGYSVYIRHRINDVVSAGVILSAEQQSSLHDAARPAERFLVRTMYLYGFAILLATLLQSDFSAGGYVQIREPLAVVLAVVFLLCVRALFVVHYYDGQVTALSRRMSEDCARQRERLAALGQLRQDDSMPDDKIQHLKRYRDTQEQ